MISIYGLESSLQKEAEALERADIPEENKEIIRRFIEFKLANGIKLPRILKYMRVLRLTAERYLADKIFGSLTREDIITVVAKIEQENFKEWTKHDYKLMLKTLLRWLGKEDLVAWMKIKSPQNDIRPEDLLKETEINAMIEAAINLRDYRTTLRRWFSDRRRCG